MTSSSGQTVRSWLLAFAFFGGCAGAQQVPAQPTEAILQLRADAQDAAASGDHERAAEAFLAWSRAEPDNPAAAAGAAEHLGRIGRHNEALDLLEAANKRTPNSAELLTALAKAFHVKADSMAAEGGFDINVQFYLEDTIRTAEQVLGFDESNLAARLLVASAQFQLGRLDPALEQASKAAELAPTDYGAQAMLGKVTLQRFISYKQAGQTGAELEAERARAKNALEAAARADANRGFPWVKLGDLLAWDGNLPGALDRYREGLSREPGAVLDHDWLRRSAAAGDLSKMYGGAADQYQGRDTHDPALHAVLVWYRSRADFDREEWGLAREGFTSALEARPDLVQSLYFLTRAAWEAGDEQGATKHAVDFAGREPRRFADMIRRETLTISILRGMAQRQFEGSQLATCRELNHVLALATNTVDDWNNYALLCRDTGRFEDSYRAYELALEIEQSPQLLNDAAVVLHYHLKSEENLATAKQLYERAIERAEWLFENAELGEAEQERTRIALRDAKNNLRALSTR